MPASSFCFAFMQMDRLRFSQRAGHKPVKEQIQTDNIDQELRNGLWSVFHEHVLGRDGGEAGKYTQYAAFKQLYHFLWLEFFKYPIDTLPSYTAEVAKRLRVWYFQAAWYEVYDFIEFVASLSSLGTPKIVDGWNYVLEREVAGYRLIDKIVTPITDEHELAVLQAALDGARASRLSGVAEHLHTALAMLSDRKEPDYRNSVKESISAVESLVKIIAADPKADLARALKAIEAKTPLHGALKAGFLSLYGYTSDEGGIRHALLESPNEQVASMYLASTLLVREFSDREGRWGGHPFEVGK